MREILDLDFDSKLFGYKIGKVTLNETGLYIPEFIEEAKRYKLVYIFSNSELDKLNLNIIDKKVILSTQLTGNYYLPDSVVPFDHKAHSYEQLQELALQSGIYSRFNTDPNFTNNEYLNLYLRWLKQSINGTSAFEINVISEQGKLAGFITVGETNKDTANIGLLAVSDIYKGKGYGTRLIQKALNTSSEKGYRNLEVVTQMQNIPALTLYQKMGFKIKTTTNIYHYWNI